MTITELIGQLLAALVKCGDVTVELPENENYFSVFADSVESWEETEDLSARVIIRGR